MARPTVTPNGFSIFSHSLGDHSVHALPSKLRAAVGAGFTQIELSIVDLEHHAYSGRITLLDASKQIGSLCRLVGLKVVCLQPLRDMEAKDLAGAVKEATALFPVMDALGTELLLCCSSSLGPEQVDRSNTRVIDNLRAIGHAAGSWKPAPKRIAFEGLCWGTFINTWSQAWEVVEAVDLENVGLCVDSFNSLAREWADPTVEGGIQPGADERLISSLSALSELPGSKIFLLQIGDGRRLPEPIPPGTRDSPALMRWSRTSRLFPMETARGGYLPVQAFVRAVIATGYRGPWSVEVFNSSLFDEGEVVAEQHAGRAFQGLQRLTETLLGPIGLVDLKEKNEIAIIGDGLSVIDPGVSLSATMTLEAL